MAKKKKSQVSDWPVKHYGHTESLSFTNKNIHGMQIPAKMMEEYFTPSVDHG